MYICIELRAMDVSEPTASHVARCGLDQGVGRHRPGAAEGGARRGRRFRPVAAAGRRRRQPHRRRVRDTRRDLARFRGVLPERESADYIDFIYVPDYGDLYPTQCA